MEVKQVKQTGPSSCSVCDTKPLLICVCCICCSLFQVFSHLLPSVSPVPPSFSFLSQNNFTSAHIMSLYLPLSVYVIHQHPRERQQMQQSNLSMHRINIPPINTPVISIPVPYFLLFLLIQILLGLQGQHLNCKRARAHASSGCPSPPTQHTYLHES